MLVPIIFYLRASCCASWRNWCLQVFTPSVYIGGRNSDPVSCQMTPHINFALLITISENVFGAFSFLFHWNSSIGKRFSLRIPCILKDLKHRYHRYEVNHGLHHHGGRRHLSFVGPHGRRERRSRWILNLYIICILTISHTFPRGHGTWSVEDNLWLVILFLPAAKHSNGWDVMTFWIPFV